MIHFRKTRKKKESKSIFIAKYNPTFLGDIHEENRNERFVFLHQIFKTTESRKYTLKPQNSEKKKQANAS